MASPDPLYPRILTQLNHANDDTIVGARLQIAVPDSVHKDSGYQRRNQSQTIPVAMTNRPAEKQ
jgi:hypothetical protein